LETYSVPLNLVGVVKVLITLPPFINALFTFSKPVPKSTAVVKYEKEFSENGNSMERSFWETVTCSAHAKGVAHFLWDVKV
jgi:hypothetical protein